MSVNAELKAAIVDYAKTWPVFDGYKAPKYSKKYLSEHEADIAVYRAARATFQRVLAGAKLPKMDALKAEYQKLTAEKWAAYKEYRAVRKDMQEVVTVKANIDRLFGLTDAQKIRNRSGSDGDAATGAKCRHRVNLARCNRVWGAGPNKQFNGFTLAGKSVKFASVNTLALLAVLLQVYFELVITTN